MQYWFRNFQLKILICQFIGSLWSASGGLVLRVPHFVQPCRWHFVMTIVRPISVSVLFKLSQRVALSMSIVVIWSLSQNKDCLSMYSYDRNPYTIMGWVGLWGFLWWAPSAKGKDHHGVSSGWSSVWHRSNTGLSSTQYEQIPIILGIWPFWLTPFFFQSITFWRAYG